MSGKASPIKRTLSAIATLAMLVSGMVAVGAITAAPAAAATTEIDFSSGYSLGELRGQNGWGGYPGYDTELVDSPYAALRFSNATGTPSNMGQLTAPAATPAAGETDSGAELDIFEFSFTLESSTGEFQPGLNVQMAADGRRGTEPFAHGTRAGGTVNLRHVDGELEIWTTWPEWDTETEALVWPNAVHRVDPTVAHTIRYQVRFVDGDANDEVSIWIDDELLISGSTWEEYHDRYEDNAKKTVDTILFRTYSTVPLPGGFGYVAPTPIPEQLEALEGNGFLFSDLSYGTSEWVPPTTAPCETITAGPAATNLDSAGWTFTKTRAAGNNTFVEGGIRVTSTTATTTGKAAGEHAVDIALSDVGEPKLYLENISGTIEPGLHLSTDFDNDGTVDGVLVGESVYYGPNGQNYWLDHSNGNFVEGSAPTIGGGGSSWNGTLNDWLVSFPHARVLSLGYSLGSHVPGEWLVTGIDFGCEAYTFGYESVPAPTSTVTVNDHQIAPDADPYTGWHEGYTNATRQYSVKADGLHFATNVKSQIINGYETALTTEDLEALLTSASVVVESGTSVTIQVPLTYGPENTFATLRSTGTSAGTHGVSVTDKWWTSKTIPGTGINAHVAYPLADLVAAIESLGGDISVLAFGLQSDNPAVVSSLTWNGTKYDFAPLTVDAPVQVRVTEEEIANSTADYYVWHEGYINPTAAYFVDQDGLHLAEGARSQIIKGLNPAQTDPSIGVLIDSASVTVEAGEVTYQVPIFYGEGNNFTTLRSESLASGTHQFDLTSQWTASSTIPDTAIVKDEYLALGDILDDLTNVRVLAFGVQTEYPAIVSSIVYDGTEYVFAGPIENLTTPTITGTAKVGETVTANPGTWAPEGVEFAYEWRANGTPIEGATGATYDLTADEFGKNIVVYVTGSKDGYDDLLAISNGTIVAAADLVVGTPSISGAPQLGGELTADPGLWGPGEVALSYQWLRNGAAITDATDETYTLVAADVLQLISVEVTGTSHGYLTESATSAAVGPVLASAIVVVAPTVTGTPAVGNELAANPGTWVPGSTEFSYQWRVDGLEVPGATGATYTPVAGDVGKDISVTVTGTAPSATPVAVTSDSVGPVALGDLDVETPTISGTAVVGDTLTADAGEWGPAPVELSYQWRADLTPIPGATGIDFVITADEVGTKITVVVTGTKTGYNPDEVASVGTDTVVEGMLTTAVPTINGTPKVGVELTADAGAWAPSGVEFSYQWFADAAEVGTDSATYTPDAAQAGAVITVAVTGSIDGYTEATETSAPTAEVAVGDQAGTVSIDGDLVFGETLTAVETGWDGAALTYEWFVDAESVGTGETYEVGVGDVGGMVTVQVTAVLAGYADGVSLSDAVGPVATAPMTPMTPTITGSAAVGQVLSAHVGTWVPSGVSFAYQWLASGSPITGATGSTYTVQSTDVGDTISVRVTGTKPGYTPTPATSAPTAVVLNGAITVDRLSGADRYAVGVSVSKALFPDPVSSVPVVYVAHGGNFPDALSSAPAAVHEGGPLLLTPTASLPTEVRNEIIRLNPDKIVVSGGPSSVSNTVFSQLQAIAGVGNVVRLAGADRYSVSRQVIELAWDVDNATFPVIYVTTGATFPDALSASAAAGSIDAPLLLVPGTSHSLDAATKALLADLDPTTIKVAGGSVSIGIINQLATYGSVVVLGGADRYVASQTINADAFSSSEHVYLSTGLNFPDGLVGAALAGQQGAPLFTVPTNCVPAAVLAAINNLGASKVHLLGGPSTLTADVFALDPCS